MCFRAEHFAMKWNVYISKLLFWFELKIVVSIFFYLFIFPNYFPLKVATGSDITIIQSHGEWIPFLRCQNFINNKTANSAKQLHWTLNTIIGLQLWLAVEDMYMLHARRYIMERAKQISRLSCKAKEHILFSDWYR